MPVSRGRQQRSRRTFQKLLDAAEALLAEKTFEEIRVEEIVARARSSIGSFYARFSDKDALRLCLIERYHDDMIATASDVLDPQKWEGVGLEGRAEAFVRGVAEVCRRRHGLMRMRSLYYMTHPGAVSVDQQEKMRTFVAKTEAFFRPVLPEPRHNADLSFALRVVDTMIATTLLLDREQPGSYGDIDDEALVRETTALFVRYLGA